MKTNSLLLTSPKGITVSFAKEVFYAKERLMNRLRRFGTRVPDHCYLFILSPPYCGSTLLTEMIATSANVSSNNKLGTREGQTLPGVRKIMFTPARWNTATDYPWLEIRQVWEKYWDLTKPILMEKSPANLMRALSVDRSFDPAYFICFYRNPYAHCESLMRVNGDTPRQAASFAVQCLSYQQKNINSLQRMVKISYEDMTNHPDATLAKLKGFLPGLSDVTADHTFKAHNFKGRKMKLTNLNDEKIAKITREHLQEINTVFSENRALLAHFGYTLIT